MLRRSTASLEDMNRVEVDSGYEAVVGEVKVR